MADVLKLLVGGGGGSTSPSAGAGNRTPAATTNTLVYTVPPSTMAMLSRIIIANTSATPTTFRIAISASGTGSPPTSDDWIAYDVAIAGNETINFAIGAGMAAGDMLYVYNTLATLVFTPLGIEVV